MYDYLQDPALYLTVLDAPLANVTLNSIDLKYPFCLYFLAYLETGQRVFFVKFSPASKSVLTLREGHRHTGIRFSKH